METPSSTRRVTRSLAISAINSSSSDSIIPFSSNKTEDSGICQRKNVKAQEDRSALIDKTNDSPIVRLPMQTPPSVFMVKSKNSRNKSTPGSGEALLRGQAQTLLHKVEERTELIYSMETRPFIHLVTSPIRLLAPTPEFPNFLDDGVQIRIASPIVAGHLITSQEPSEIFKEKEEKSLSITRSLLLDFTDKSVSWEEEDELNLQGNIADEEIVEVKEVLYFKDIPTPRKHTRF